MALKYRVLDEATPPPSRERGTVRFSPIFECAIEAPQRGG
jgi:hypothetical protein